MVRLGINTEQGVFLSQQLYETLANLLSQGIHSFPNLLSLVGSPAMVPITASVALLSLIISSAHGAPIDGIDLPLELPNPNLPPSPIDATDLIGNLQTSPVKGRNSRGLPVPRDLIPSLPGGLLPSSLPGSIVPSTGGGGIIPSLPGLSGGLPKRQDVSVPGGVIPSIPGVTEPLSTNAPPLPILQVPTPPLQSQPFTPSNIKPKKIGYFWTGAGDNEHKDFLVTASLDDVGHRVHHLQLD